jgi:hypothetical protein
VARKRISLDPYFDHKYLMVGFTCSFALLKKKEKENEEERKLFMKGESREESEMELFACP